MRPAFRITPHHLSLRAALALVALPQDANAQESAQKSVNPGYTDTGSATLASTTPAAAMAPDTADAASHSASGGNLTKVAVNVPADQRGGFHGMLMAAATPQLMRGTSNGGNGVTLWDEIAPPLPLPIPLDAAANAQGNIATCQQR